MHNQTISWNDNWTFIFVCLVGRLLDPYVLESFASSSSSFTIAFLIQMLRWIRGSSWVESFWIRVHIPHHVRNLLWIVRAWYSIAPIFASLVMIRDSSCVHSSQSLLKVINFLLAHIQGGHNNLFFFFDYKLFLEKPFFNWFLNVILWLIFLHSNKFVKASNNYFGFFKDDTWRMRLSLI